ncbi:GNAT family N-acetyltransferase [Paenibacillus sp. CAU 1782]
MVDERLQLIRGTREDANYVREKLIQFNAKNIPGGRYEEVQLSVKDENGFIVAGLNGEMCWNWMEIDILWVEEQRRGQGLGKQLLMEAEQLARSKACDFIKLNTFTFQAPEFYKKYGYVVLGEIDNAPKGHRHYYYIKRLNGKDSVSDAAWELEQ